MARKNMKEAKRILILILIMKSTIPYDLPLKLTEKSSSFASEEYIPYSSFILREKGKPGEALISILPHNVDPEIQIWGHNLGGINTGGKKAVKGSLLLADKFILDHKQTENYDLCLVFCLVEGQLTLKGIEVREVQSPIDMGVIFEVRIESHPPKISNFILLDEENWFLTFEKGSNQIYSFFLNSDEILLIQSSGKIKVRKPYQLMKGGNILEIDQIAGSPKSSKIFALVKNKDDLILCISPQLTSFSKDTYIPDIEKLEVEKCSEKIYSSGSFVKISVREEELHILVVNKQAGFIDVYTSSLSAAPSYSIQVDFGTQVSSEEESKLKSTKATLAWFPHSSELIASSINTKLNVFRASQSGKKFSFEAPNMSLETIAITDKGDEIYSVYSDENNAKVVAVFQQDDTFICDNSCNLCIDPGIGNCLSCKDQGLQLVNYNMEKGGTCGQCSTEKFKTNEICFNCPKDCEKCSTLTKCDACTSSFYLQPDLSCLDSCPIKYFKDPPNSFQSNSDSPYQCSECLSDCATCSQKNTCDSCEDSSKYLEKGACITSCSSKKFIQNEAKKACDPCTNSCETCETSTDHCLTCVTGRLFHDNKCEENCPISMTQKPSDSICKSCSSKCNGCLTTPDDCVSCAIGYTEIDEKCEKCISPCSNCSGKTTTCSSCLITHPYLEDGTCVQSCSPGYYVSNNDPKTCTVCPAGTSFVEDNSCVKECSNGKTSNPSSKICEICNDSCTSCTTSKDICDSCKSNHFLSGTSCNQCSSNCLECKETSDACTTCKSSGDQILDGKKCVSVCPDGKYDLNRGCKFCTSPCSKCETTSTTCTDCDPGHTKEVNICKPDCNEGEYLINNSCQSCDKEKCKTCAGTKTSCTSCSGDLLLEGSTCVEKCSDGFFKSPDGTKCLECESPCLTCINSSQECKSCKTEVGKDKLFLYGSSCVSSCPDTTTQIEEICQPCKHPCQKCDELTTKCSSCASGFYYYLNKCYEKKCPFGSYLLSDNLNCSSCDTDLCADCETKGNKCVSCVGLGNKFLEEEENKCLGSCPDGKFGNTQTNTCEKCKRKCSKCKNTPEFCTSCHSPFILEESSGKCLCPQGQFLQNEACSKCSEECKECSGSPDSCSSCQEGYILNEETKKCLKKSEGECPTRCVSCDLAENICQVQLDFSLKLNEYPNNNYDIVIDIFLKGIKEGSFNLEELKSLEINAEAIKFSIKEVINSEIQAKIFWNKNGIISIGLNLPEGLNPSKKYTLVAKPISKLANKSRNENKRLLQDETEFTTSYILTGTLKSSDPGSSGQIEGESLSFSPPPKISEGEKRTAEVTSITMSTATTYTSAPAEYISFFSMIFSADPSGATLKFSQISKLISRLRLININFGGLLSLFMDGISRGFGEKKIDRDLNSLNSNGFKGKIDFFGVRIFLVKLDSFFENGFNLFLYLLSWLMKGVTSYLIWRFKKTKKISMAGVKFIQYQRKVHFIFFNITVVDMAYYGTRTVIHTRVERENLIDYFFIVVCYLLSIWDLVNLAWISVNAPFKPIYDLNSEENNGKKAKKKKINEVSPSNESKLGLKEKIEIPNSWREINEKSMIKKRLREEEVGEGEGKTITEDKAIDLGYKKRINYKQTLQNLSDDEVKERHATSQLRENPDLFKISTVLLSNYFFLLRVALYHIILVSLPHSSILQCFLLLFVEFFYIGTILKNYIKHKFLGSVHVLISKIIQSGFLSVFLIVCFVISIGYREKPVTLFLQKVGLFSIIIAIAFEYFFLVYNVVYIVVMLVKNRNKVKVKYPVIVFEWVLEEGGDQLEQENYDDEGDDFEERIKRGRGGRRRRREEKGKKEKSERKKKKEHEKSEKKRKKGKEVPERKKQKKTGNQKNREFEGNQEFSKGRKRNRKKNRVRDSLNQNNSLEKKYGKSRRKKNHSEAVKNLNENGIYKGRRRRFFDSRRMRGAMNGEGDIDVDEEFSHYI